MTVVTGEAVILGLALGGSVFLAISVFFWPALPAEPSGIARGPVVWARERLTQAGLPRTGIPTVLAVCAILAVAATAVVLAVIPIIAAAVAASLLVFALPWMLVLWRARAQRRATRVVWPDVVDHLVSAVRSGLALPDSVVTLAHTGPLVTRAAFSSFESHYRASGNFSDALDRLKTMLRDPVADRILETLRMSREVGGNDLTTVLRGLATYLRQDAAIRSEVEARQSWVVNAARLGVAAPWVVLVLLSTRPEAAAAFNTPAGGVVIGLGLATSIVAYRLMIRLGRLPEEHRWFG